MCIHIIDYINMYIMYIDLYCNYTRSGKEREPGTTVSLHDLMQDIIILHHVQKQGRTIDKIDVSI